jgi:DNA-binding XRE family transcriptional regulator
MDDKAKSERGRVGGLARAASLTPEERSEIARKAVQARWRMAKARAAATPTPKPVRKKNPNAVALGKLGGLKGGLARAENMTAKQRSDAARFAAKARWAKRKELTPKPYPTVCPGDPIGPYLRAVREASVMTVKDLACKIGITHQAVYRTEKCRKLRKLTLLKYCRALGIDSKEIDFMNENG